MKNDQLLLPLPDTSCNVVILFVFYSFGVFFVSCDFFSKMSLYFNDLFIMNKWPLLKLLGSEQSVFPQKDTWTFRRTYKKKLAEVAGNML